MARTIELLMKVPVAARAEFARTHLMPVAPDLVRAFAAIPRDRLARTVLYASFTPHTRETRLAAAARRAGWNVFHICLGTPRYRPADYFAFHARMDDPIKFVLACWLFPGALVHAFAMNGKEVVLLAWLKPRRVIFDLYDTISGSLDATTTQHQLEREAIAQADGLTHRDLRIKKLQKLHGYVLPPQNVFIHDPLPAIPPNSAPPFPDGEIHVVSTGWIGSGDNNIMRVARALCSRGIHLHIYFNPFQQGPHPDTQCYWDYQRENPYFHIETQLYGDAYWVALRRYDFGLSVLETAMFGEKLINLTPDSMAGCGSSRVSDYVAVGLGVIVSPELAFQHFWSRRFAPVAVAATRAFLDDPLPALRQALEKKQRTRPKELSSIKIEGAVSRLGRFYERVAARPPSITQPLPKVTFAVA